MKQILFSKIETRKDSGQMHTVTKSYNFIRTRSKGFVMHKLFLTFCLTVMLSVITFAQSEINRNEFYVGYSNNQAEINSGDANNVGIDNFFDGRASYNGFEVAATHNVSRFVGAKFDFSAHFKEFNDSTNRFGSRAGAPNFRVRSELYNSTIGAQIKDNSKDSGRVKPFGQVMVGLVYGKNRTPESNNGSFANSAFPRFLNKGDYGVGGIAGGGLDIKLGERVDFRAIQVDYNPTRLFGKSGFVFH